jgi:hypothetical protein
MAEASSSTAPPPASSTGPTVVRPEKMDEATYTAIQQYRAVRLSIRSSLGRADVVESKRT